MIPLSMSLRLILRTQYIGSIVVGMLCFQGLTFVFATAAGVITRIVMPARGSVLEPPRPFNWDWLMVQLVSAALYFGSALFIFQWAKLGRDIPLEPATEAEAEHDNRDEIESA
jgi:hypothetical protein